MKFASLITVAAVGLLGNTAEANLFRWLMEQGDGDTCSWNCKTQCATCTASAPIAGTNTKSVTIDLGGCKSGTVSWMCCKDTVDCRLSSCKGKAGDVTKTTKCDELTQATYIVPADTTKMKLQVHDGQLAGDKDCSEKGTCCGGAPSSCGTISGVCDVEVDLSTCPAPPPSCTSDLQCGEADASTCTKHVCIAGKCNVAAMDAGTECRRSEGPCDIAETCDGSSMSCPDDLFELPTKVCRKSAGDCDPEETCTGSTAACPENVYASNTTVCRPSAGDCDPKEMCTGSSPTCPDDVLLPADTVCREAKEPCDVPEVCTGKSAACPQDAVATTDKVCRDIAGPCDVPDHCDGKNKACPVFDEVKPFGAECRAKANPCDVPEVCDGTHTDCPADLQDDQGKVFKCGRTCYLCGIPQSSLVRGNGSAYSLSTCGIGACDSFVSLPWPSCVNECVSTLCPNRKGLSNIEHFTCDHVSGNWGCKNKQEAPFNGCVPPSYSR